VRFLFVITYNNFLAIDTIFAFQLDMIEALAIDLANGMALENSKWEHFFFADHCLFMLLHLGHLPAALLVIMFNWKKHHIFSIRQPFQAKKRHA
jgi:hypothetical protein